MSLTKEQVIEGICHAFYNVHLGDGVGLHEGQGWDDYADAKTMHALMAQDEKFEWDEIPAEALNRCHSSLSFFDAAGMRFHLPAFMVADLSGDLRTGLDFCLSHVVNAGTTEQFALFDLNQKLAVRDYILFIKDHPDHEFYRDELERALQSFWDLPPERHPQP